MTFWHIQKLRCWKNFSKPVFPKPLHSYLKVHTKSPQIFLLLPLFIVLHNLCFYFYFGSLTSRLAYLFLLLVFVNMALFFSVFYNNLTNRDTIRYFIKNLFNWKLIWFDLRHHSNIPENLFLLPSFSLRQLDALF